MGKKKAVKASLIPEERLRPLRAEIERLADEQDYAFPALAALPFYHAIVYYMLFEHFRDAMRERLGGIDDDTALANAFFWYSVVFGYAHGIGVGLNPLADEPTMDHIEGAPTLYFTEAEYTALIQASEDYVAARPLSRAEKASARKLLSQCR
jgi:hypothetical protein